MLYDMKKTLTHSNEFKLYEKNMSPENKESFQNNARIKNFFQNINCCKSGSKDQKRFSNEILINAPKKEVDFKSFFRTVFEKSEEKKHSEDFMKTSQMSHLTSTKKQQNPISIQMNQRNNPHENEKTCKKYKYSIFNDITDTKNVRKYLENLDNLLSRNSDPIKKNSVSFSPQKEISYYSFSMNEDQNMNESQNLLRLSRKYLRESNRSSENPVDLSLGEFLCINCDEFIDLDELNIHSKTCEKMPENQELIIINYKLEKVKTALLLNMKREVAIIEKNLEGCLNILINCIQKAISSNENERNLIEIIEDLKEISKELNILITNANRTYITLLNRIKELTILKRQIVIEKMQNSDWKIEEKSLFRERKIFSPPNTHLPLIEQNKHNWDKKYDEDHPRFLNNYTMNYKKRKDRKIIFKELDNYRKNEEFLVSKPKEISYSPPNFNRKIVTEKSLNNENWKESENFKRIKIFLQEREKKNVEFNEKISKIGVDLQKNGDNIQVVKGDTNRRKKFLELTEKLKEKMCPNHDRNLISNSELYEECQNNQIHENNWEGFVTQKFKNTY